MDIPACYECREKPALLTVKDEHGTKFCFGCPQCKYFSGAAFTKQGAWVSWCRENSSPQTEHNLTIRRKRQQEMSLGELKIHVIKKESVLNRDALAG